jgi:hypothetical protein
MITWNTFYWSVVIGVPVLYVLGELSPWLISIIFAL